MPAELQVLVINGVLLAYAYLWVYPSLAPRGLKIISRYNLIITTAALGVVGYLFWGTGVLFSLVFFDVKWPVFTIVTSAMLELPMFYVFMKKYEVGS